MFCGLCEDACPTDALELTQDFELASYTRDGAIWDRETLEKGRSRRSIGGRIPTALAPVRAGERPRDSRQVAGATRFSPGQFTPRDA